MCKKYEPFIDSELEAEIAKPKKRPLPRIHSLHLIVYEITVAPKIGCSLKIDYSYSHTINVHAVAY